MTSFTQTFGFPGLDLDKPLQTANDRYSVKVHSRDSKVLGTRRGRSIDLPLLVELQPIGDHAKIYACFCSNYPLDGSSESEELFLKNVAPKPAWRPWTYEELRSFPLTAMVFRPKECQDPHYWTTVGSFDSRGIQLHGYMNTFNPQMLFDDWLWQLANDNKQTAPWRTCGREITKG